MAGDLRTGVYKLDEKGGRFYAYGDRTGQNADFDKESNEEAKAAFEEANRGIAIYGSYQNGVFRPAGAVGGEDRVKLRLGQGQREIEARINFYGELLTEKGEIMGKMQETGEALDMEQYKQKADEDIKTVIRDWNNKPEGLANTPEDLDRIRKEAYTSIVNYAERVGIAEEKIRDYGKQLQLPDEEVRAAIERRKSGGLENKVAKQALMIVAGLGVLLAMFYAAPSLTGNVISVNNSISNIIGSGVLFLIGLTAGFLYLRRK